MFQLSREEKTGVVTNCDHLKKLKFFPNLFWIFPLEKKKKNVILRNSLNEEIGLFYLRYMMKKLIILLIISFYPQVSYAVLAPQYQNSKDLDVMVEFINKHSLVVTKLKSIDFLSQTIYFGDKCKATFSRKTVVRPPEWDGPAAPLEFKKSNCAVD